MTLRHAPAIPDVPGPVLWFSTWTPTGLQGAAPVDAAAREDDEVVANVDPALPLMLALNRSEPRRPCFFVAVLGSVG
jgi:hypothetical protein